MGITLSKFQDELNKHDFKIGKGAFLILENIDPDDKDFVIDCQKICLKLAPYSLQEDPSFILNEKIPQPVIGACLYVNNKLYCSSRSGKKIGDHAEFTVIEEARKTVDNFDDSIIFTSLEPCTEYARHKWTTSCSEYIIGVGIPEVYIGCLDANPAVTGLGVEKLINRCKVHFFDKELVFNSKELNKQFFNYCRSDVDGKVMKDVVSCLIQKLDEYAVSLYLDKRNKKGKKLSKDEWLKFFQEMIDNHSIIPGKINKYDVTPDFALAFYKKPSVVVPNFKISIYDKRVHNNVQNNNSNFIQTRSIDFESTSLISMIANTSNVKQNIYLTLGETILHAKNVPSELYDLLKMLFKNLEFGREMIINALVHSDYSKGRGGIDFEIEKGKLIIFNPIIDKTVGNDLENGVVYSLPQNPRLMQFLNQAGLVEMKHYGMDSIDKNSDFKTIYKPINRSNMSYLKTSIDTKY